MVRKQSSDEIKITQNPEIKRNYYLVPELSDELFGLLDNKIISLEPLNSLLQLLFPPNSPLLIVLPLLQYHLWDVIQLLRLLFRHLYFRLLTPL